MDFAVKGNANTANNSHITINLFPALLFIFHPIKNGTKINKISITNKNNFHRMEEIFFRNYSRIVPINDTFDGFAEGKHTL
jgi:hypothetical protein